VRQILEFGRRSLDALTKGLGAWRSAGVLASAIVAASVMMADYNGPVWNANIVYVQMSTGSGVTDVTNIDNAVIAAGNAGAVFFPANQTYTIGGCGVGIPGSTTVLPALLDLRGSTLKLTGSVATTTTASGSTGIVHSGDTTVNLVSGGHTLFCVGDNVFIRDASYANNDYTYPDIISACGTSVAGAPCTSDTLTLKYGVSFAQGGPTAAGSAVIERVDLPLQFGSGPSSPLTGNIRITNGVFGGNSSNRSAQSQNWSYGNLVFINSITGRAVVDHNIFQNSSVNGLEIDNASYARVADNYFTNIAGNGSWPGGNGTMVDFEESGNHFYKVYQFTGSTLPTVAEYGHTFATGAMSTSTGATRAVISNNIVDTSTGYCFNTVSASYDTQYVIAGNVFYHCDMGGFDIAGGGYAVVTGNLVQSSGHDTPYVTSAKEVTKVTGTAVTVITGNEFYDSVLNLVNDAQQLTVAGNLFDDVDLSNTHRSTNTNILAALWLSNASTYGGVASIIGNTFVNPQGNITDALDDIRLQNAEHVTVSGNEVYGGWIGLYLSGGTDITANGNNFVDQSNNNSSYQNATAILASSIALTNVSLAGNSIFNDNSSTYVWQAIDVGSPASFTNVAIKGNIIDASVAASNTTGGIRCGSETGAGLSISANVITMPSTTPAAINCPSLTSAAVVEWNKMYPTAVTFHQGSAAGVQNEITGTFTLSSGTVSVTGLPFASNTTYSCFAQDTTALNPVKMVPTSGSAATVTGTGSDAGVYDCKGS